MKCMGVAQVLTLRLTVAVASQLLMAGHWHTLYLKTSVQSAEATKGHAPPGNIRRAHMHSKDG